MGRSEVVARIALSVTLGLSAGLSACGEPQLELESGTIGSNGQIGSVKLRNVLVEPPPDGRYESGDHAVVRWSMFNDAHEPDALIAVESDAAQQARLFWDQGCNDTFAAVSQIPLLAEGTVPGAGANLARPSTPFYLRLKGLEHRVLEGTTVPLTLTFQHAGTGSIDAIVLAADERTTLPPLGCSPDQRS